MHPIEKKHEGHGRTDHAFAVTSGVRVGYTADEIQRIIQEDNAATGTHIIQFTVLTW